MSDAVSRPLRGGRAEVRSPERPDGERAGAVGRADGERAGAVGHAGPAPPGYGHSAHRRTLRRIIRAYDSPVVRAYTFVRFLIININILHILRLCMKDRSRILEIGCGFGLFGCYFALRNPDIRYHGVDVDEDRIAMARRAARRLGLDNATFECADARDLEVQGEYDAVLMMDLMHHLSDDAKAELLDTVLPHLQRDGRLVVKEITRRPAWRLAFTWILDVLMTRGFDMWYWTPRQFREAVSDEFHMDVYPIADWLPYPHVVYLFSRASGDRG